MDKVSWLYIRVRVTVYRNLSIYLSVYLNRTSGSSLAPSHSIPIPSVASPDPLIELSTPYAYTYAYAYAYPYAYPYASPYAYAIAMPRC